MRGTKSIGLKSIVDDACAIAKEAGAGPGHVLVYDNAIAVARADCSFVEGRDYWYQDEVAAQSPDCPCEWMDAEVGSASHCCGGLVSLLWALSAAMLLP